MQDLTTAYNVARSNLDAARFNARFARIDAPVDGIVFERMVESGDFAAHRHGQAPRGILCAALGVKQTIGDVGQTARF